MIVSNIPALIFLCLGMIFLSISALIFQCLGRYGRMPALFATNMVGALSCLLTATATSFGEYALWKFVAGLAFDNIFVMMYVLGEFLITYCKIFQVIYRSFRYFNCRPWFRTFGPHQYSAQNKKKLTNRRCLRNKHIRHDVCAGLVLTKYSS